LFVRTHIQIYIFDIQDSEFWKFKIFSVSNKPGTACGHKEGQITCNRLRMSLRRTVVVKTTGTKTFEKTQKCKNYFQFTRFRLFRKNAVSDYQLRRVCLSVRVKQLGCQWLDFHQI
jgi:hypothetical protein